MDNNTSSVTAWQNRTKTMQQLVQERQSFADQNLTVVVTDDAGATFKTVKLVSKGFVSDAQDPNAAETVYGALHI